MADKKKKVVKKVVGVFSDAGKAAKARATKRKANAVKFLRSPEGKAWAKEQQAKADATPTAKRTVYGTPKKKATPKSSKEKKSTEENMKYLMDSGQRKYDPKTGMVMNRGGLAKKRSIRK